MGMFARFGGHDFIAYQQGGIFWTRHVVQKDPRKQGGTREHCRKKPLHRPIPAPCARPPGQAQHGDAPCSHHHGSSNPMEVAQGRGCHIGLEALAKCYNIHRGLPQRVRVAVVVDNNSTTAWRWKPLQVRTFWRRYCCTGACRLSIGSSSSSLRQCQHTSLAFWHDKDIVGHRGVKALQVGKLINFDPVETQEGKFDGLYYSAHVSSIHSLAEHCKMFSRRTSRLHIRTVHTRPEW